MGALEAKTITKAQKELPKKNLMGIPWRLALALQNDGWILRQDIIWEKPNCMPESVKDRCTKAHEYIFLFSKQAKYYFNSEAVMEPAVGFNDKLIAGSKGSFGEPQSRRRKGNRKTFRGGLYTEAKAFNNSGDMECESRGNTNNLSGLRRMRSVWKISTATRKTKIKHYARFPDELVKRCILMGSSKGDIVLDPFMGSGTTCRVAEQYMRHYLGIELNFDYYIAVKEELHGGKVKC